MIKDFDGWNTKKKKIDSEDEILFFREGEIWWVHLGLNIGYEINGKGEEYMRPVLILRKYNEYSFLSLPLSTSTKNNDYHFSVGMVDGKKAVAILSQLRNIDSRRLINKIGHIEQEYFSRIKQKTSQINFG